MSLHERFELMSALAATRQLDPSEQRELDCHIRECGSCRASFEEFQGVVHHLSAEQVNLDRPMCAENDPESAFRFMSHAHSQGIRFSTDANQALIPGKGNQWQHPQLAYTVALVLIAAILPTWTFLKVFTPNVPAIVPAARILPPPVQAPSGLESAQTAELQFKLDEALRSQSEIPLLKQRLEALEQDRKALQTNITQRDATIDRLRAGLSDGEEKLASAQAAMGSLNHKNEQANAELAAVHIQANDVSEQLRNEKASVEQERQLTAATKEVRELMGARRLFMVDVFDGEANTRSSRSFGRVFYTEGRSLIFYAFDLDKNRHARRVTFQAWGEKGKASDSIKPLGVFHIDDAVQKRWVMKMDDPEKLKTIDAIFVTVEQDGGVDRPTGQKLLYAYLGGQPNHP